MPPVIVAAPDGFDLLRLPSGILIDATVMDAPSPTKNEAEARDTEMSCIEKAIEWYFGIKARIGVEADSGAT